MSVIMFLGDSLEESTLDAGFRIHTVVGLPFTSRPISRIPRQFKAIIFPMYTKLIVVNAVALDTDSYRNRCQPPPDSGTPHCLSLERAGTHCRSSLWSAVATRLSPLSFAKFVQFRRVLYRPVLVVHSSHDVTVIWTRAGISGDEIGVFL